MRFGPSAAITQNVTSTSPLRFVSRSVALVTGIGAPCEYGTGVRETPLGVTQKVTPKVLTTAQYQSRGVVQPAGDTSRVRVAPPPLKTPREAGCWPLIFSVITGPGTRWKVPDANRRADEHAHSSSESAPM